jgi:hypothetical protein
MFDSVMMLAWFTRTSTPPNSFSVALNIRDTSTGLLTSATAAPIPQDAPVMIAVLVTGYPCWLSHLSKFVYT